MDATAQIIANTVKIRFSFEGVGGAEIVCAGAGVDSASDVAGEGDELSEDWPSEFCESTDSASDASAGFSFSVFIVAPFFIVKAIIHL